MKEYIFSTFLESGIYSLPFILLAWAIVILVSHRRHQPIRWLWLLALAGLIATLVNLFQTTFTFEPLPGDFRLFARVNLIPFVGIMKMVDDLLSAQPSNYSLTNFFGNIGFFIPLGFFIPFLSKKIASAWKVILMGCGFSLFIEICQLFMPTRGSDIDDIILNTLGTALGYLLFWVFARLLPKFVERTQG
jgi:glycopeptide antibiotics resistance protein